MGPLVDQSLDQSVEQSSDTLDPALVRTADLMRPARHANWIHVVSHLDPKYGGLSSAVPALSSAVAAATGQPNQLAAFCLPDEHFVPTVTPGVTIEYFPLGRSQWFRSPERRQKFRALVRQSSGVHIHGLWQASTSAAARLAQTEKKPYVISAHGMLESWALANKRIKKSLYAALFERANLRAAAGLHALTEAEAADYRRFGLTNPITVIPNGVDVPAAPSPELFFQHFKNLAGRRIVLFLGRIHFKKGLDLLADAWARLSRQFPAAHLVLAGPDFEGTQARIVERLRTHGIAEDVTFAGMLSGNLKWSALAAAECFVLPSYSEGLSVSVLEAMGMGLPVVITEQCNLPEVATHGCGWTIRPKTEELEAALVGLLRATRESRQTCGANGRKLVAERFTWHVIGRQMGSLYERLAGGREPNQ
ncbi:MAG TPA: glycosyltransferase [Bryobacteraceae bacterium]|nr:glycosyltransferase [Bryobacteraceae bacterium]